MAVLIIYVLLVAVLEVIVVFVGIAADSFLPAGWDLVFAMTMFFGVIFGAWPIAVLITERWFISDTPLVRSQAHDEPRADHAP